MPAERIPLQRTVAVVREDSIAVRPSRGQLLGPVIELGIALAGVAAIVLWMNSLPLLLLMLFLLVALILGPIGILGIVYNAIGSSFLMERKKETARWQQGFLGMGIGTVDLVPFRRIKRIEVVSDYDYELASGEIQDLVQWEVVMVKDNDKRLTIGGVAAARSLADLGAERANRLAERVASMAGAEAALAEVPVIEPASEGAPVASPARRRRRSRRISPPPGKA
ncbi:MAG: hypothetical protein K1X87_06270 [Dehalococcoidia bacterium]|nr:hypothetical protein [Dehalococcoidia bacterium]